MRVEQICTMTAPMIVPAPVVGPDVPVIMGGNDGIVPPWLRAIEIVRDGVDILRTGVL